MTLIRWDPWADLAQMRDQLDTVFGGLGARERAGAWMPAADVSKEDGSLVIRLDLPGMKEQDVKVRIEGRQLVVSGERHDEQEETREGFYSRERRVGSFVRSFVLPTIAVDEDVTAEFADGVLSITVPLGKETAVKEVSIQTTEPVAS